MQREEPVSDAEPGKPRTPRAPELNPFEAVNFFFDRAADHAGSPTRCAPSSAPHEN